MALYEIVWYGVFLASRSVSGSEPSAGYCCPDSGPSCTRRSSGRRTRRRLPLVLDDSGLVSRGTHHSAFRDAVRHVVGEPCGGLLEFAVEPERVDAYRSAYDLGAWDCWPPGSGLRGLRAGGYVPSCSATR